MINTLFTPAIDSRQIKRQFNVVVERTVAELNGVSCLALDDVVPDKQQIIALRSFADQVTDHAPWSAPSRTMPAGRPRNCGGSTASPG